MTDNNTPMTDVNAAPTSDPLPNRRAAFFLLFFSLMAIGAGNTMLIAAVIPPLIRDLALPDWVAGAIFSLSALCWSLSSPFWGKRSNRWGRRRVAAIGLAGYSVSMALLFIAAWASVSEILTGTFAIFMCLALSRAMFGLIGSGTNPAAQAYVADRTAPDERQSEIAFITSGFSLGTIVGPAFAAVLVTMLGILSPMIITATLAGVMAILVFRYLPENRAPVSDGSKVNIIPGAAGLWRSRVVFPFLLYAVSLSLVTGILTQVFPFIVIDQLNLCPAATAGATNGDSAQLECGKRVAGFTGPAFMVGAMAVMISQLALIPLLRLRNKTLMIAGCGPLALGALLLLSVMLLPADQNTVAFVYPILITAQFFIGIGQGLARPGFSSGASLAVSPELQGNVAGLVISANGMGYIVTPLVGLVLYQFISRPLPFVICFVLIVAMAIFAHFAISTGVGEHAEQQPE